MSSKNFQSNSSPNKLYTEPVKSKAENLTSENKSNECDNAISTSLSSHQDNKGQENSTLGSPNSVRRNQKYNIITPFTVDSSLSFSVEIFPCMNSQLKKEFSSQNGLEATTINLENRGTKCVQIETCSNPDDNQDSLKDHVQDRDVINVTEETSWSYSNNMSSANSTKAEEELWSQDPNTQANENISITKENLSKSISSFEGTGFVEDPTSHQYPDTLGNDDNDLNRRATSNEYDVCSKFVPSNMCEDSGENIAKNTSEIIIGLSETMSYNACTNENIKIEEHDKEIFTSIETSQICVAKSKVPPKESLIERKLDIIPVNVNTLDINQNNTPNKTAVCYQSFKTHAPVIKSRNDVINSNSIRTSTQKSHASSMEHVNILRRDVRNKWAFLECSYTNLSSFQNPALQERQLENKFLDEVENIFSSGSHVYCSSDEENLDEAYGESQRIRSCVSSRDVECSPVLRIQRDRETVHCFNNGTITILCGFQPTARVEESMPRTHMFQLVYSPELTMIVPFTPFHFLSEFNFHGTLYYYDQKLLQLNKIVALQWVESSEIQGNLLAQDRIDDKESKPISSADSQEKALNDLQDVITAHGERRSSYSSRRRLTTLLSEDIQPVVVESLIGDARRSMFYFQGPNPVTTPLGPWHNPQNGSLNLTANPVPTPLGPWHNPQNGSLNLTANPVPTPLGSWHNPQNGSLNLTANPVHTPLGPWHNPQNGSLNLTANQTGSQDTSRVTFRDHMMASQRKQRPSRAERDMTMDDDWYRRRRERRRAVPYTGSGLHNFDQEETSLRRLGVTTYRQALENYRNQSRIGRSFQNTSQPERRETPSEHDEVRESPCINNSILNTIDVIASREVVEQEETISDSLAPNPPRINLGKRKRNTFSLCTPSDSTEENMIPKLVPRFTISRRDIIDELHSDNSTENPNLVANQTNHSQYTGVSRLNNFLNNPSSEDNYNDGLTSDSDLFETDQISVSPCSIRGNDSLMFIPIQSFNLRQDRDNYTRIEELETHEHSLIHTTSRNEDVRPPKPKRRRIKRRKEKFVKLFKNKRVVDGQKSNFYQTEVGESSRITNDKDSCTFQPCESNNVCEPIEDESNERRDTSRNDRLHYMFNYLILTKHIQIQQTESMKVNCNSDPDVRIQNLEEQPNINSETHVCESTSNCNAQKTNALPFKKPSPQNQTKAQHQNNLNIYMSRAPQDRVYTESEQKCTNSLSKSTKKETSKYQQPFKNNTKLIAQEHYKTLKKQKHYIENPCAHPRQPSIPAHNKRKEKGNIECNQDSKRPERTHQRLGHGGELTVVSKPSYVIIERAGSSSQNRETNSRSSSEEIIIKHPISVIVKAKAGSIFRHSLKSEANQNVPNDYDLCRHSSQEISSHPRSQEEGATTTGSPRHTVSQTDSPVQQTEGLVIINQSYSDTAESGDDSA